VTDRPRLLHRRSELGYTDRVDQALTLEPEAVDEATQSRITRAAKTRDLDRRRTRWHECRTRLLRELAVARELFGTAASAETRAIGRAVDRLDRQLR
jgi:hypothetical protein